MPNMNFNCCESINISSINFNCGRESGEEIEFNLINQESKQYKFDNLLPDNDKYLYIKILKNGKVICLEGGLIKVFHMKKKDILDVYLKDIKTQKEFFLDFISPLFEISIEKGDSFQFMFTNSKIEEELVCSIYPCCIPGDKITSIDIVVRSPKNKILNTGKYIIDSD